MTLFDFETICVQGEVSTKTTLQFGSASKLSVSVSSNLIGEAIFLCKSSPKGLLESFIKALDKLATPSKTHQIEVFGD